MIVWQSIIVMLFLDSGVGHIQENGLELKLLFVVFRHGEKVPHRALQNYQNDPNANYSYYPVDDGDLTNVGKRRMYEMGQRLREIYGNFLGEYYLPSLIYARSTDVTRTQMSLQLFLAGLFPPVREQIWDASIQWQPVSTFSVPNKEDFTFFPSTCTLNVEALKKVFTLESVKQLLSKYKDDLEYIAHHSGKQTQILSYPDAHSLLNVLLLHNLFEEQTAHNLTLPKWTRKVYPKVMKEIALIYMNIRSYSKELRRYNGGILLHEITENIRKLREKKLLPRSRKAFVYSAHEFNIIAMARVLNLSQPVYPRYGSTFIIEVLKDKIDNYYIRVILWTGEGDESVIQRIPNCDVPCPFEKFCKVYEDVIPTIEEIGKCRNVS